MRTIEPASLDAWLNEQIQLIHNDHGSRHQELIRALDLVKQSWFEKAQIFADSSSPCSTAMAFLAQHIPAVEQMCREVIPHINSHKARIDEFVWSVIAAAKQHIQTGKDFPVYAKIEHCASPWAYLHCLHCKALQHLERFDAWGAACVDCVETHRLQSA